ncbi:hypothetical protein CEXT_81211, partial [Caerostris extrusa]
NLFEKGGWRELEDCECPNGVEREEPESYFSSRDRLELEILKCYSKQFGFVYGALSLLVTLL